MTFLIRKYIPNSIKNRIKYFIKKRKWKGKSRIFCISMQRTGTTSVGDFFEHFGFPRAAWGVSWRNGWSRSWYDGDFESIFISRDFLANQVFEDDPWWLPEFYKVLYHRFPESKFILFVRNSNSWMKSMKDHSNGKTLGNTKRHCKIYRREREFYNKLDTDPTFNPSETEIDNLLELRNFEEHYKSIYEIRNREIIEFFNLKDPDALVVYDLEDTDKWKKLGKVFGLSVQKDFDVHSNKSKKLSI